MQVNSAHMSCTATRNFDGDDLEVLLCGGLEANERLARDVKHRSTAASANPKAVRTLGEVDHCIEVLDTSVGPERE